jgi:hypothetical protein
MSAEWDVPSESDENAWDIENVSEDTWSQIVSLCESGRRVRLSRGGTVVAVMVHPAELDAMFARYGRLVWDLQRETRRRKKADLELGRKSAEQGES